MVQKLNLWASLYLSEKITLKKGSLIYAVCTTLNKINITSTSSKFKKQARAQQEISRMLVKKHCNSERFLGNSWKQKQYSMVICSKFVGISVWKNYLSALSVVSLVAKL